MIMGEPSPRRYHDDVWHERGPTFQRMKNLKRRAKIGEPSGREIRVVDLLEAAKKWQSKALLIR